MVDEKKTDVLFVAVRRHHYKYFSQIVDFGQVNGQVQRLKNFRVPAIKPVFKGQVQWGALKYIVALKLKERAQARREYRLRSIESLLFKVFYTVTAVYKYLSVWRFLEELKPSVLAMWGGPMFNQSICRLVAQEKGMSLLFFENGHLPETTTIDSQGVNYLNSLPRNSEFYQNLSGERFETMDLVPRSLHKKRENGDQADTTILPEKYIFVPFQLDVDRQILVHSPWFKNIQEMFEQIRSSAIYLPEGWKIVFKEHPSSEKSYPHLHARTEAENRLVFANDINTQELIERAKYVLTINSTVGLEALMMEKPVGVMGEAFYGIDGLVDLVFCSEALNAVFKDIENKYLELGTKNKFLTYLKESYLVAGDWRQADKMHLEKISERISSLIKGSI